MTPRAGIKQLSRLMQSVNMAAATHFQKADIAAVIQQSGMIHAGSVAPIGDDASGFPAFRVETIADDGAYAVSFRLDIAAAAYRPDLRIMVDIGVEAGVIGVGCMVQDYSAFVDDEQIITAGPRRKVYVAVGAPG